jgi:hypothetical protein
MVFRQLYDPESSTYTYLIADPKTKMALLVDPVLEQVERDLKLLQLRPTSTPTTLQEPVSSNPRRAV